MLLSVSSCTLLGSTDSAGNTDTATSTDSGEKAFYINGANRYTLQKGDKITLTFTLNEEIEGKVTWTSSHSCVNVENGVVTVLSYGTSVVKATIGDYSDSVIIIVPGIDTDTPSTDSDTTTDDTEDPYIDVDVDEFYANYKPAQSYEDAYFRTLHNLMSGTIGAQDQAPTISAFQPKQNGKFIRNSEMLYSEDGCVYYVVDAYGDVVMEIYKGAAYIMLEEVAAHVFAFGEPPANQTASKNTKPTSSEWGIYLRLNHTSFSGSTSKYPYEPELPNISGCGGTLSYYEMDIGTTGTDCDPAYYVTDYNDGTIITRGAARIVYCCEDDDQNGTIDADERYVFYTYNHYNDFQEYLNYYGGWGEMFGNITGGGKLSSKSDYNPTPYVEVALTPLKSEPTAVNTVIYFIDTKKLYIFNNN